MGALIILFFLCIVISVSVGGGSGLAIGLFVGLLIIAGAIGIARNNARESEKKAQDDAIIEEKIHKDIDYCFKSTAGSVLTRYIVDNVNKKIYISNTSPVLTSIPFSEIIGCDILTDSEVTGGVGRAVVGGVLAGSAGAVVGATTAKKKITSYSIIIYKNTVDAPSETLSLINSETKTSDLDYKEAVKFSHNVSASIRAIIEQEKKASPNKESPLTDKPEMDNAQELRKYKELLDDGIITQEEFDAKKKQLLGL